MNFSAKDIQKEISNLNKELSDTHYEVYSYLGHGSFAKVFEGLDKKTNTKCAIKVYIKGNFKQNLQDIIYDEINILKSLDHPNIVRFYSFFETSFRIFLIMELISGGSLKSMLDERKISKKPFTNEEIRLIMSSLINAVKYLHENEIVHRDLKPENILLADKNGFGPVKIIDFGLSVKFNDFNKNLYLNCGTPLFIAPELKKYKIYSKPVDIWSCGIIFYELCTFGGHPFYNIKNKKEYKDEEQYNINIPSEMHPY